MEGETESEGDFFPIVDSHIHLFEKSHLGDLRWQQPDHPLHDQYSVGEYEAALQQVPFPPHGKFGGFVFVETDRITSVAEADHGWDRGIEELVFVSRFAIDQAVPCLAMVGWAPVPGGRSAMIAYRERLEGALGAEAMKRTVGWRYLVQDKPPGTMIKDDFVDSLRWMGEQGYSFDLGVDFRSGGVWQLQEANEMIERAIRGIEDNKRVKIIIDHMGKPSIQAEDIALWNGGDRFRFRTWSTEIAKLALFPNVYMKISGLLSEMEPLQSKTSQEMLSFWRRQSLLYARAVEAAPWIKFVLETFTVQRCMFGSDWPVCNIGGGGNDVALNTWLWMVYVNTTGMNWEDQARLWGGTAMEIYKIDKKQ